MANGDGNGNGAGKLGGLTISPSMLMLAFLTGASGSYGVQVLNPPRPDPFTGAQGKLLEQRVERQERILEAHITWSRERREEIFEVTVEMQNMLAHHEQEIDRLMRENRELREALKDERSR